MRTVTVTTALALSEDQLKAVKEVAIKKANTKDITLVSEVDPTVIGGVRLTIDGIAYDATVQAKLNALANT